MLSLSCKGLLRDAEHQFKSALKMQPIVNTYLELCNVYTRLDLPNTALDLLKEGSEKFNMEPRLLLGTIICLGHFILTFCSYFSIKSVLFSLTKGLVLLILYF